MARRAFDGEEWAMRDLRWAMLAFLLFALGAVNVFFLYALLALGAYGLVRVAIGAARRRKREQAHDEPFWVDALPRPPGPPDR